MNRFETKFKRNVYTYRVFTHLLNGRWITIVHATPIMGSRAALEIEREVFDDKHEALNFHNDMIQILS